jgi:CBS domain-containing protein
MRPKSCRVGEYCVREVVTVLSATPLTQCAKLMHDAHVGCVVVIKPSKRGNMPLGIITDRDIAIEVVAFGLEPETLTAGDLMQPAMATVHQDDDLLMVLAVMREHGVRRLPVTGKQGVLIGIVSADDLLTLMAGELDGLVSMIRAELTHERETRRRS